MHLTACTFGPVRNVAGTLYLRDPTNIHLPRCLPSWHSTNTLAVLTRLEGLMAIPRCSRCQRPPAGRVAGDYTGHRVATEGVRCAICKSPASSIWLKDSEELEYKGGQRTFVQLGEQIQLNVE
jgi:hypothetical protein